MHCQTRPPDQAVRAWGAQGILAPILAALLISPLFATGFSTRQGEATSDPEVLSVMTGQFSVSAGSSFECFYTTLTTDRELNVVAVTGRQDPTGHHISAYYTDTPRTPEHHPCASEEMLDWHLIIGTPGSVFRLPEGLAMKIPAGKQFVLQSHHLNTTGMAVTADDRVDLSLIDPATVRSYIETLVAADTGFEVPPYTNLKHVTTCVIPRPLKVTMAWGHMHQFGTHYRLEIVDAMGQSPRILYEQPWEPLYQWNPPIQEYSREAPLELAAGTQLRQTCTWNNPTESPLRHPHEMCVAMLMYLTDKWPLVEEPLLCQTDSS